MSEASSAVRWLLDQAEPEARRVAVQQIAKVRGREAPELLLRALGDDDWRVRKEAALVAPVIDRREEVVAVLVSALEETINIGLRNAAVEALVAVGPDAVGAVVEAFGRFDADARKLAVEVLGGISSPEGITALLQALADDDANVNVAAAEALGGAAVAGDESRESAIAALVDLLGLGSSNIFLKIASLDSLARLGARLPWKLVEPFVTDASLRRYAIAAAAGSRDADAVRALAEALSDPSPTIARDALVALGDLLADAGEPLDEDVLSVARGAVDRSGHESARRAARSPEDTRARAGALTVLGLLGHAEDVALLVSALGEDDLAERADAAVRLFGPAAVGPLLTVARDAEPTVRAAAMSLAASLDGADLVQVRSAVRESLKAPAAEVASCAVEVLGAIGDSSDLRRAAGLVWHADDRVSAVATKAVTELAAKHVGAARALLRNSRPPHDPVVLGCILLGAIASTGSIEDADVQLLERALEHDDPKVRRAAIDALASAGGAAAADAVVFALSDEEREVQLAAVRALGRLRRVEPLIDIAGSSADLTLVAASLRALGEADPERAMAAASPLIRHVDPGVACAAVEAVGLLEMGDASGGTYATAREDALFTALDHPDVEVVKLGLSIVGMRPGTRGLVRLGSCLDHPSWEVRRLSAELLAQDKSVAAQRLLRARYERENDPIVRQAIGVAVSLRPPPDGPQGEIRESISVPHGWKAG